MKIYYSNMQTYFDFKQFTVGCLFSYYAIKEVVVPEFCDSFFLDSGAFSAFNTNKEIDLQKYIDFVYKWKDAIDVYASLDVIGNAERSKDNYLEMLKQGLSPLPCVHIGTDISHIDFYLKYTNYIALGGMAKKSSKERKGWLDGVFSNFDCQFHGFGIQDVPLLKRYPWHSVDASSWHLKARSGWLCTPWGSFMVSETGDYVHYPTPMKSSHHEEVVKAWVAGYGVDFELCKKKGVEAEKARALVNIRFYEDFSKGLEKPKFNKRGSFF